jgi:hypothetical protein
LGLFKYAVTACRDATMAEMLSREGRAKGVARGINKGRKRVP